MVTRKTGLDDSASAPAWNFVKVYREPLEHPMFRGRMDWIGAWILVQAAADWQTNWVNLTDVGRKAGRDYGWDNDKWRRFVKRLEKESFIATIEKKNFGNNIGHVHIALIVDSTNGNDYSDSTAGESAGATRVPNVFTNEKKFESLQSKHTATAGAQAGAPAGTDGPELNKEVWLIVDDGEDEGSS